MTVLQGFNRLIPIHQEITKEFAISFARFVRERDDARNLEFVERAFNLEENILIQERTALEDLWAEFAKEGK